jgi:hypothetical protein
MSDDIPWLPPRRSHRDDTTFGDATPATKPGPELNDVPPDDPSVAALVSALVDQAERLPPPPDAEHETPPPFDPGDPLVLARKEHLRPLANADLLRNYVERRADEEDDDLPTLRMRVLKLEMDLKNLQEFVRDDFKRRDG